MTIDLTDAQLDALLKRLHLANTRRAWRDLVQRAERDDWSYRNLLALLVAEEIAHRQQTRIGRMVRRARFPFLKTIDDFNFSYQSIVRLSLLGSALAPDFVTEGRCLILAGKPGRGKTHLAVAIAYRAIQNGFDALFVTAAELIDDLSAAFRRGQLADALARYVHPSVVVIDEVGYLTYGTDAANMLFHVVNDRHRKKRAMIFTTNKPLAAWGSVLHEEDLAHAIVDRILERGRMLTLDGPSLRTKHLGLDDPTADPASTHLASLSGKGARISGIQAPEFPEPTTLASQEAGTNEEGRWQAAHSCEVRSSAESHMHHDEETPSVSGGQDYPWPLWFVALRCFNRYHSLGQTQTRRVPQWLLISIGGGPGTSRSSMTCLIRPSTDIKRKPPEPDRRVHERIRAALNAAVGTT